MITKYTKAQVTNLHEQGANADDTRNMITDQQELEQNSIQRVEPVPAVRLINY